MNLVPSNEGHESGQAMPDVTIIVMVVRNKGQAFSKRGVFRQSFRPGDGVVVPGAVVGVAAAEAEEATVGGRRRELLELNLPLLVGVVHGAHEPRVPLESSVGVTQVLEGQKRDGAPELLGGGGCGGVEGSDVEEGEEDGGGGEEEDEELLREN